MDRRVDRQVDVWMAVCVCTIHHLTPWRVYAHANIASASVYSSVGKSTHGVFLHLCTHTSMSAYTVRSGCDYVCVCVCVCVCHSKSAQDASAGTSEVAAQVGAIAEVVDIQAAAQRAAGDPNKAAGRKAR